MEKNNAFAFDAVIVANGDFPCHEVPLSILRNAPHVVACDGAIVNVPQAEAVVGDGDSIPVAYRNRLVKVDEQDDNDLTKATRYCLSRGWHRIAFLGTTGLREDHTLGNIALLMRYYREMDVNGIILTDHGIFTPMLGRHTFQSFPGQQISIFNFGCRRLTSEGLKWPSYAYHQLWQGTLNESLADTFTLDADSYYLVFQTYQRKSMSNGRETEILF